MIEDNFYQTFQLESSNIRGRVVRLGSVLDDILRAHNYPSAVSDLVAESITLTIALSSMLKYEGIFTLQAQGDGALNMLVADMDSSKMVVRGCAAFKEDAFENLCDFKVADKLQNHLVQYLGKGHIAFTVDQGKHAERYQGIVELKGSSMVDCVQHYFNQSEQIATGIKMAVGMHDGKWRGSAIMLQHMPEDQNNAAADDSYSNSKDEDWRRAMILMDSCTENEFLSTDLSSDDLLLRLFHEEGVRVYDRREVKKGCRCDEERVKNIAATMSRSDIGHMIVDGKIEMKCEFCSTIYELDPAEALKNAAE